MFGLSGQEKHSAVENPVTLADIHAEELYSSPAPPKHRLKALGWLSDRFPGCLCGAGLSLQKKHLILLSILAMPSLQGCIVAENMLTNLICIQII